MLTGTSDPAAEVLPSLSLLPHSVRLAPAEAAALAGSQAADIVLIDSRRDLMHAKSLFRELRGAGLDLPMVAIVAEGGWAAVTADWDADDVILHTAGPGEVEARLRLAIGRRTAVVPASAGEIRSGDLVIDEASYSVRLRGRTLDLTFKEFELLKFLAQHPARVFTRSQLLQEVWGYDYFGGTRTVDVHVRRLRAKLGAEYELLIGTVRNVGYRFVPASGKADGHRKRSAETGQPDRGDDDPDPAGSRPARRGDRGRQPGGRADARGGNEMETSRAHARS
jgi:DNA-binding response OmpR family regulator